jgi:hypothetical protein
MAMYYFYNHTQKGKKKPPYLTVLATRLCQGPRSRSLEMEGRSLVWAFWLRVLGWEGQEVLEKASMRLATEIWGPQFWKDLKSIFILLKSQPIQLNVIAKHQYQN